MYVISKIKGEHYNINWTDINWNAFFNYSAAETKSMNDSTMNPRQTQVILNLWDIDDINTNNTDNNIGLFYTIKLSTFSYEDVIVNKCVADWMNEFFAKINADIDVKISERKIKYNNSVFAQQQEEIDYLYSQIENKGLHLINNANGVIINMLIDSMTCPDVLIRKFDSNAKTLQQLTKQPILSKTEYIKYMQKQCKKTEWEVYTLNMKN